MQTFIDTETKQVYSFDDDVQVISEKGVNSFTTSSGVPLDVPVSLQPYTPPKATAKEKLTQSQAVQSALVSAACRTALQSGFNSSALGSECTYPSKEDDQRNLLSAAIVSQGKDSAWTATLWCQSGGAWSFVPHTAAQVQQVNADWVAFRESQQKKCADLIAKINAATSIDAATSVSW